MYNAKRLNALAKPKQLPDLRYMQYTQSVSKSAVQYTLPKTSRIWDLSKPKNRQLNPRQHKVLKTIFNEDRNPNKYEGIRYRIIELAQPKLENRHVHNTCVEIPPEKSYRRPFEKQTAWLKKNSAPRKMYRPPITKKNYTKLSEAEIERFFERLAMVPESKRKKTITKEHKPKINTLPDSMLTSVNHLSVPRKLASEMRLNFEFDPYIIPPEVLNHKASKRTQELAEPKVYETSNLKDAVRENPFEISRSALKYKATPLIKKLAMPKQYD
ncbi:Testicular haploid expressed repeat [Cinara cedri]|uniref:Testicular haploid expressed repeat n=1 Tax=Cinara cedri TaxID=506608 RepID=A0A5E4LZM8_9HEMI|nr:Testicular haploid expressed repeat [Cinara cedri]